VSRTFHGRDIFAPVAARLAQGMPLEQVGPPMAFSQVVRIRLSRPEVDEEGVLTGTVVAVDRFGNLITDIDEATLEAYRAEHRDESLVATLRNRDAGSVETHYGAVPRDASLALIGSRGVLEVAVNRGSAADRFQAGVGDRVRVKGISPK
jgi:S-adenosylmethionine hydrolase